MEFGKLWIVSAVCAVMFVITSQASSASVLYTTSFGKGKWNQEDWVLVKSPRWEYTGAWIQHDDFIENRVPADKAPDSLVPGELSYMSMVLRDKIDLSGDVSISSTMEFEHDQAPQIVLAYELGANDGGHPEYREHFEVVLYSRGVNIWHHRYADGKPSWALVAYSHFPVEAGKPHLMQVDIQATRGSQAFPGKTICVTVNDHKFAYHEPSLPDEVYVGLIGYASKNRFYDFTVRKR